VETAATPFGGLSAGRVPDVEARRREWTGVVYEAVHEPDPDAIWLEQMKKEVEQL